MARHEHLLHGPRSEGRDLRHDLLVKHKRRRTPDARRSVLETRRHVEDGVLGTGGACLVHIVREVAPGKHCQLFSAGWGRAIQLRSLQSPNRTKFLLAVSEGTILLGAFPRPHHHSAQLRLVQVWQGPDLILSMSERTCRAFRAHSQKFEFAHLRLVKLRQALNLPLRIGHHETVPSGTGHPILRKRHVVQNAVKMSTEPPAAVCETADRVLGALA
mmetsp:Transcript_28992/g.82411  ORF Transcript_28992/g.82411 Transcript_28992/m.82411 type:complete len:216 (+) Transcript_28992:682-1329(+)